jgi:sensor histidine kinase YesM
LNRHFSKEMANKHEEMFNILSHKGNSNQSGKDSISPQSEWLSSRKQITNAGEDGGGEEYLYIVIVCVCVCVCVYIYNNILLFSYKEK